MDKEQFEAMRKDDYIKQQSDINNLSYWFPKIKDCGIKVPETLIIPIDFDQFKWFISDSYKENDIMAMGEFIHNRISESSLKDKEKVFIKTGTFSNKFDFNTCKVENLNEIGTNFLSVYYASMCVGAGESTEIVVREFIESDPRIKTIYEGMPLNTEFRVFYDFDKNEVLGIFNYWDRKTMVEALNKEWLAEDFKTYLSYVDTLEENYNNHKDYVIEMVNTSMKDVQMTGAWSIDIMQSNGEFYLIDMATAQSSYYYHEL